MELWTAVATGLLGIVVPVFTLLFNQGTSRRSITTLREVATDKDLSQTVRREAEAALVQLIGAPKLMGRGLLAMGIGYAATGVVLVVAAIAGAFDASGRSYGILGAFAIGMGIYLIADISAKRDAVTKDHDTRVQAALEGREVAVLKREKEERNQQKGEGKKRLLCWRREQRNSHDECPKNCAQHKSANGPMDSNRQDGSTTVEPIPTG